MDKTVNAKWVRLGDYIEQRREKYNRKESFPIRGVSKDGLIDPKQKDADLSMYNVFYMDDFIFNPARMEVNSIALNDSIEKGICSSLYEIFSVNKEYLLPEFLNLFVKRDEFARQCAYIGWGSAREYCRVSNISDIEIPLPPIEVQKELVDAYNGIKAIAEQNEALCQRLSVACHAYIVDCKSKFKEVVLGDYIEQCTEKNKENTFTSIHARGVYCDGTFGDTRANLSGSNLTSYKVVKKIRFCLF